MIEGFVLGVPTGLFLVKTSKKPPTPPEPEYGWILAEEGKENYFGIWDDNGIWIDSNVWYD